MTNSLTKLSPTLRSIRADDFEDAVAQAVTMVEIGGIGHTSGLYTNQDTNAERIRYFGDKMKTARILINIPTTHGGIGDCTTSTLHLLSNSRLWFMGW